MSTIPPVSPPVMVSESVSSESSVTPEANVRSAPAAKPARSKGISGSIVEAVVTLAVLGGISYAGWKYQDRWLPWLDPILAGKKEAPPKPQRVVPVTTAVVRTRDMPVYLTGLGTVTPFKTVTLRARVEGELKKVSFVEGQMVQEGDLLAEIDPRQFEVQLAQSEGQLARDQAILKSARATLSRLEGLQASKSITAQEVEDQALIVNQTMASIQTDEATVRNSELQLSYCSITAPITGRIGLRLVDQGNIVRPTDPNGMAVITQLQPIAVVFTIPQDEISQVQLRSSHGERLAVDAYNRDFSEKLASGKLLAIDNQVDATTGTVRIKAEFENNDGMLFPNQFVNARLLVETRRAAVVVPSAAVQRGTESRYVYVVKVADKKTTVQLRNVDAGESEGGETLIKSGLVPGEIVVTDGLDKLRDGAPISPRDKDSPNPEESEKKPGNKPDAAKPKSVSPSSEREAPTTAKSNASATSPRESAAEPDEVKRSSSAETEATGADLKLELEPAEKPTDKARSRETL